MEGRYSTKSSLVTLAALIMSIVLLFAVVESQYCGMSQDGFTACEPACTKTKDGSAPPSPTDLCCSAVRGANLNCLCGFANSPLIIAAYNIDTVAAEKLPVTCNVDPNFHC